VLSCDSLSTFKSRLKTHLFSTAFCQLFYVPVPPAPLWPPNGIMALYKSRIIVIIIIIITELRVLNI